MGPLNVSMLENRHPKSNKPFLAISSSLPDEYYNARSFKFKKNASQEIRVNFLVYNLFPGES